MSLFTFNLNRPLIQLDSLVNIGSLFQLNQFSTTVINFQDFLSESEAEITIVLYLNLPSPNAGNNSSSNGGGKKLVMAAGCCFGVAVLAPVIVSGALVGAGFGSAGVVAGSAAASWQSYIGSVVAGSFFATCTSAGMGGAGLATLSSSLAAAATSAGTACVAADGALRVAKTSRTRGGDGGNNHNGEDDGGDDGGDNGRDNWGDDGGDDDRPDGGPNGQSNRRNDDEKKTRKQKKADAQLVVVVVPKAESKKWQVEKHAKEDGSELRFRDETGQGSSVAFFINRTGSFFPVKV